MQKTLLDHIPQTDLEKMRNCANMASRRTSPKFFLRFSNNSYANNFGGKNLKKIRDVEVDALYKTAKFGCSSSNRFRDIARQSFICEVAPPSDRFEIQKSVLQKCADHRAASSTKISSRNSTGKSAIDGVLYVTGFTIWAGVLLSTE